MKQVGKEGFSLIELMVAMLVLLVLVVGGAMAMSQSGGGIQRQQNKREAVVAANSVLESYWSTTYSGLGAVANSTITRNVTVNGRTVTASISISSETADAGGGKYYEIKVSLPGGDGETVNLVSRRYEKGLSKAKAN